MIWPCFETPIWVVCIHFRLNFHLHRRPELRSLIDDLEAILINRHFICIFECLLINRNFITGNVAISHWVKPEGAHSASFSDTTTLQPWLSLSTNSPITRSRSRLHERRWARVRACPKREPNQYRAPSQRAWRAETRGTNE